MVFFLLCGRDWFKGIAYNDKVKIYTPYGTYLFHQHREEFRTHLSLLNVDHLVLNDQNLICGLRFGKLESKFMFPITYQKYLDAQETKVDYQWDDIKNNLIPKDCVRYKGWNAFGVKSYYSSKTCEESPRWYIYPYINNNPVGPNKLEEHEVYQHIRFDHGALLIPVPKIFEQLSGPFIAEITYESGATIYIDNDSVYLPPVSRWNLAVEHRTAKRYLDVGTFCLCQRRPISFEEEFELRASLIQNEQQTKQTE